MRIFYFFIINIIKIIKIEFLLIILLLFLVNILIDFLFLHCRHILKYRHRWFCLSNLLIRNRTHILWIEKIIKLKFLLLRLLLWSCCIIRLRFPILFITRLTKIKIKWSLFLLIFLSIIFFLLLFLLLFCWIYGCISYAIELWILLLPILIWYTIKSLITLWRSRIIKRSFFLLNFILLLFLL